ncbi:recombination protein RecR [Candidatus Peribacteria bacterium]|nr:recombination protein RecR [Candidatus Peribacteria bacterium]MBT4020853.1 recombination protein RecR [Candidatus Peribacteria bacterium]MBT4241142.1 recombination protein RecR [Candidatus Peribacteria bacterium]MBT4473864.1 recombination protein RecR [Candidatus Peribacteria bacterium]
MQSLLPQQIQKVIEEFSKLPGIGSKSAERLTFFLLRSSKANPMSMSEALSSLKQDIKFCSVCQMVSTEEVCPVCLDRSRDTTTVLVVEEPLDLVAFEKSDYKGLYHVLHGVLSPIDGMGPEQLKISELITRCKSDDICELIIATDPDVEGEATATFLKQSLSGCVDKITRLAHGLPMGAEVEFADQVTLKAAVAGRREL